MPQSRLGPLAIESKLGDHPSQSSVWRAVHVQLKRAVAVKVFAAPFGGTPEARATFAKEWESLKRLQHPAIVRCYGGGFEKSEAYLAHELIEGPTLSSELEHRTRLSWELVLDLAETLTDGLDYLHKQEIVYGALQPDKVLFAGLSPVLIDVRVNRSQAVYRSNRPPTHEEVALRAPELSDPSNSMTPHSDLYSLGATLYWALTGRPPICGETIEEVLDKTANLVPDSPASIVLDCPIWLDKLVMQLLEKNPEARPHGAAAVRLALREVRRRSMSRAGVAEHASAGFSPLNVTDQSERDEARVLLGHGALDLDDETFVEPTAWHDKPIFLIAGLLLVASMFVYFIWPLNESQMRRKAELLLARESRTSMNQAKVSYLIPMIDQYPEGENADWAREQIDQVNMVQAEHLLSVKLKRNFPLKNEGERLYAEANEFERFGDTATALDRYRSMETLLGEDPEYIPFVNLARRQIALIESEGVKEGEAARIIQSKLDEADRLYESGQVVGARKIWYSVVELYGNNGNVAPLVGNAQARLANDAAETKKDPQ